MATQEFMMAEAPELKLGLSFLAVYLNGDNLFPDLRDARPVRGEKAIGPTGNSLDTYNQVLLNDPFRTAISAEYLKYSTLSCIENRLGVFKPA